MIGFKVTLKIVSNMFFYNNTPSDIGNITHGVPQWSILGPLLFILYMNGFPRASNLLFSILYADDTNIFIEGTEYHKVISTPNTELLKVSDWLNSNKLTINLKKTNYMVFHRSRIKTNSINLVILKKTSETTRSTKFLGVIIDNKLKWTDHITYIKKKISRAIGIIHRARTFLDKINLKNLYHSIVFPYLIYCTEIWGNSATIDLNPIII